MSNALIVSFRSDLDARQGLVLVDAAAATATGRTLLSCCGTCENWKNEACQYQL